MKKALEIVLTHLKEMDAATAVNVMKNYGLYDLLPERIRYGLETYRTRAWVKDAYLYLREINRVLYNKEEKKKENPAESYGIPVL